MIEAEAYRSLLDPQYPIGQAQPIKMSNDFIMDECLELLFEYLYNHIMELSILMLLVHYLLIIDFNVSDVVLEHGGYVYFWELIFTENN